MGAKTWRSWIAFPWLFFLCHEAGKRRVQKKDSSIYLRVQPERGIPQLPGYFLEVWTSIEQVLGIWMEYRKNGGFFHRDLHVFFLEKKKNSLVNMKSDGIKRSTTDYPSEWCEQPNVVPALWLCCRLVEGSSTGHLFTADSTNLTSTACQKSAQDVLFAHILN